MLNRLVNWFFEKFTKGYIDYPAAMQAAANAQSPNVGAVLASAAQITITSLCHKVTGTTPVTTVKIPTGYRGLVVFIPNGALPCNAGGAYVASDGVNEVIPFGVSAIGANNKAMVYFCDGLLLYPVVLTAAG